MTRIVEHRCALPFGPAVEVHVLPDTESNSPIQAAIEVAIYGAHLEPKPFAQPLPVAEAFLQAIAYADQAGIACVWVNDPGGRFPPETRPARDANAYDQSAEPAADWVT